MGGRRVWGPNFRAFFPSPTTNFLPFFLSWGSSREILVVFEAPGPEMCTFGVLGLSCASPGGPVWWGRRGFTRQSESPKRAHLRVQAFKNTTKIQRKGPTREGEKNKNSGGRGKKRAKFWAVRWRKRGREGRGHAEGAGGAPKCPLGGFSFVNPFHESDISKFFFAACQICVRKPCYINVFQCNRECFFLRHVELKSGFIVMTMDEITLNRPQVSLGFSVIFGFVG